MPEYTPTRVYDSTDVNFSTTIKQTPVASPDSNYTTKNVTFNSGVDVGAIVARGAIIGAGVGAVAGLAADVARQTLARRHGE